MPGHPRYSAMPHGTTCNGELPATMCESYCHTTGHVSSNTADGRGTSSSARRGVHRLHAIAVRPRRRGAQGKGGGAGLPAACVSGEFRAFAAGKSSPVTGWLRALARLAHGECGGPGVGTTGMCFTGNFALTMMLERSMLAPVLCQPSLPPDDPAGLEISADELAAVRGRLDRDGLTVLAYGSRAIGSARRNDSRLTPRRSATPSSGECSPTTPTRRRSSRPTSPVRTAS